MSTIVKELENPQHEAYTRHMRRGWCKYTVPVNVHSSLSPADGKRYLRQQLPQLSREQHRVIAKRHAELSVYHSLEWTIAANEAAMETLGRKFEIQDYRISAIGLQEFSEAHKERLRQHAYAKGQHRWLAILHLMAAGHRLSTSLYLVQNISEATKH